MINSTDIMQKMVFNQFMTVIISMNPRYQDWNISRELTKENQTYQRGL